MTHPSAIRLHACPSERPILTIPLLESGDRLTRSEFERRYDAMSQVKKAELIEGVVYVASPLRFRSHGKPHAYIMGWLGIHRLVN